MSRFPDWPPNWLLSRLSPTLREHAFEPARLDAVADYMTRRGRCRSGITRWMCAVLLRFQIIVLVVQCLRLQSETTHVSRAWRSDAMRYLLRDLRHAARALVRRPGYALVAVINDVAAARFFPGEDPVGRRVSFAGFTDPYTVIGVIGAVRHNNLSEEPRPEAYIHSLQASANNPQLVVRTRVAPESMVSEIRSTLRAVAPMLVVSRVATMADIRQQSLAAPRFSALLFGLFAALALVLATLGTYGVMAYTVAQRTREIGVRVSLGARPADVALLVGGYGLRLAGAGIALGLLGALATTHAMRSMLFGVSTTDLPTFVITATVLTVAVLAACGFTAWRAISVDPVEALRRE